MSEQRSEPVSWETGLPPPPPSYSPLFLLNTSSSWVRGPGCPSSSLHSTATCYHPTPIPPSRQQQSAQALGTQEGNAVPRPGFGVGGVEVRCAVSSPSARSKPLSTGLLCASCSVHFAMFKVTGVRQRPLVLDSLPVEPCLSILEWMAHCSCPEHHGEPSGAFTPLGCVSLAYKIRRWGWGPEVSHAGQPSPEALR